MILADTSVWVDHLRKGNAQLSALLKAGAVFSHPFVIGEVALGHLPRRSAVLHALSNLPRVATATDDEVLQFIEDEKLFGSGIGYVDAHLLASLRLTPGSQLWTKDKRLDATAARLGLT